MSKKYSYSFSFKEPWMPVKLGLLVFVSLGYCVRYFFEFIFMVNNENEFVRQLTHAIPALHKVDRVVQLTGGNPAPMKMLVAYALVGSVLLAAWCVFWSFQKPIVREVAARFDTDKPSKFICSLSIVTFSFFYFSMLYVMNMDVTNISRHEISWFSRSFSSATMMILLNSTPAAMCAMLAPVGYLMFSKSPS